MLLLIRLYLDQRLALVTECLHEQIVLFLRIKPILHKQSTKQPTCLPPQAHRGLVGGHFGRGADLVRLGNGNIGRLLGFAESVPRGGSGGGGGAMVAVAILLRKRRQRRRRILHQRQRHPPIRGPKHPLSPTATQPWGAARRHSSHRETDCRPHVRRCCARPSPPLHTSGLDGAARLLASRTKASSSSPSASTTTSSSSLGRLLSRMCTFLGTRLLATAKRF